MPSLRRVAAASEPRLWITVFAFLSVVYGLTGTYSWRYQSIDTFNTAVQGYQIAMTGSPVVDDIDGLSRQLADGRDGTVTNRLPGSVAVGVASYTLARPFVPPPDEIDHAFDIPMWPVGLASALCAAAAMATLAVAIRRMPDVTPTVALVSTGAVALGTATWSVSANGLWTHTVTQLGLAVALLGLVAGRHAVGGLGFAASVIARPHTALLAAGAGLGRGLQQRRLRPVVVIGLLSAAGLAAAMAYGMWVFGGGPSISVGYPEYSDRVLSGGVDPTPWATAANILLLFVHPVRGLLPTTPFLIPLLFVLPAAWRAAPMWARGLALGATVQLVIQGLVNPYSGGDSFFGSRLTLEFLMATVPLWLLAYQATATRSRLREWVHVTAGASVVVHLAGATVLGMGFLL